MPLPLETAARSIAQYVTLRSRDQPPAVPFRACSSIDRQQPSVVIFSYDLSANASRLHFRSRTAACDPSYTF